MAAAVLLAVVAFVAVRLAPLLADGDRYKTVASIERRGDYRDPALMAAAWRLPVAARYRALPYEYQHNPSFCGPTSVADLLHSTGVRTTQSAVIAGTEYDPRFGILLGGLTIDQLDRLLELRLHRPVTIVRGASLDRFRSLVARANDPSERIIVNFHRGPMFGRGHGHFSPILGYLPDRDLVFVGDVNASYRPYLVPTERLWRAASTVDTATGRPRGLLIAETGG